MLTIRLDKDEVTPHLRKLLQQSTTDGPLAKVLGRAGANELKKHFRSRNAKGNSLGGKRTNFWSAVAGSVQSPTFGPGRIVISVAHPAINQKVFGGTIRPKKAKTLAIPVHPAAYGNSPRVFDDLFFFKTKGGVAGLGKLIQETRRLTSSTETFSDFEKRQRRMQRTGRDTFGKVKVTRFDLYYILRKSVTQARDPEALPKDAAVAAALTRAANIHLRQV